MTEEVKTEGTPGDKHIDPGQSLKGAPAVPPIDAGNKAPVKGDEETHSDGLAKPADAEAAAAAAKVAADKKAADEAAAAAEASKDIDGPLTEFITLEHPAGQAAIDTLKEAGVGPNQASAYFAKAIEAGDLSLVDWDGIEAKVGKAKAFLIRTGVETFYKDGQERSQNTVKAAIGIFGGQENWQKVRDWAQAKEKTDSAFGAEVDAIRDMLNEGGAKANAGARELLRLYNADPGSKGLQNGKLVVGETTGTVIGTPLTRAQYLVEIKKAHETNAPKSVKDAIGARRLAGKAQGI